MSQVTVTESPSRLAGEITPKERAADLEREQKAKKQECKNYNFVQVNKKFLPELARLAQRDAVAVAILCLFAEKMDHKNAICISFRTLGEILRYSRTTLHRAVKLLETERWIQIIKLGTANAYVMNSAVFWQDGRDKKFGTFSAMIVASLSEQPDQTLGWQNVKLKKFPAYERDCGRPQSERI